MSQPTFDYRPDLDARGSLVQHQTVSGVLCLFWGAVAAACELATVLVAMVAHGGRDRLLLALIAAGFLSVVAAAACGVACYLNPRAKPTFATAGLVLAAVTLVGLVPTALLAMWG